MSYARKQSDPAPDPHPEPQTEQAAQPAQQTSPVVDEVKTTIRIDKALLDAMQKAVKDSSGKLRGSQNEAFTEAVRLWLAYLGDSPALLVVDNAAGKKHITTSDGIVPLLEEMMQDATKVEFSIYPVSSASQNFEDGVITKVSKALVTRIGRPPVIRIGGQGVESTELQWEGEDGEARLQEAQEKTDIPLELSMIYPERDLYASMRFDLIEVRKFRQAPVLDFARLGL